jgi:predicted nucleic acid-binding protein
VKYVLDANAAIAALNDVGSVRARLASVPVSEVGIPIVAVAELLFGACKSSRREENLARVAALRRAVAVLPHVAADAGASPLHLGDGEGRVEAPDGVQHQILALELVRGAHTRTGAELVTKDTPDLPQSPASPVAGENAPVRRSSPSPPSVEGLSSPGAMSGGRRLSVSSTISRIRSGVTGAGVVTRHFTHQPCHP